MLMTHGARRALRRAAANTFISEYMRACAERIVPASRARNHVIVNGLNAEYLALARERPADDRVWGQLCAVQSNSPHKETRSLLGCVQRLAAAHPEVPWALKLAGGGDWSAWRAYAAELGIAERVEFLGHQDLSAIARLFRASSCFVFPSVYEGFGMPVLEAMACGCPVVAVDATAVPSVAGDAAALVRPRDPAGLAAAVWRLHNDGAWRSGQVERGYARARAFPWSASAAALWGVFERVVGDDSCGNGAT